jgi:hypothetical protein
VIPYVEVSRPRVENAVCLEIPKQMNAMSIFTHRLRISTIHIHKRTADYILELGSSHNMLQEAPLRNKISMDELWPSR